MLSVREILGMRTSVSKSMSFQEKSNTSEEETFVEKSLTSSWNLTKFFSAGFGAKVL